MIISDRRSHLPFLLAAATAIIGLTAWIIFLRSDLVLSHYDAKAHLVVARRIFDNLTPSWQQVGAVWLPLPHLLNALPVQIDALYRTGAAASLISILSFSVAAYALARLVLAITGSKAGAVVGVGLFALNPNLLYLQATPMTEPLLIGLTLLVVLWMYEWINEDRDTVPRRLGWAMVCAMLTRYEAWPIVGAAILAAGLALWRRGHPPTVAFARMLRLAIWPAVTVVGFLINSRITVGQWFVSGGFFVPDPEYQGQAMHVVGSIWWGTRQLSGYAVAGIGLIGAALLSLRAILKKSDAAALVSVSLLAAAALPIVAFYDGHPFRIRYMIPLVAAGATLGGITVGLTRRVAPLVGTVVLGAAVLGAALIESPPWESTAPMLLEAQWDRPASVGRRAVTACLAPEYHGEKVLASMGSLAHYMQELSASGFNISDFIHEGTNDIWIVALERGPSTQAGWMLVEEQAEGGDVLAQRIRGDQMFAAGMTRVCEGGGVALYKRTSGASGLLGASR